MNTKKKKNILLVEDEVITAVHEKLQLEKYGYSIHLAHSGKDAVKFIQEDQIGIDLILMDIDLGSSMDGTQAATQILNLKDIPIVFLSSHTESEIVEKTEKITSYGYVVKNSGIVVIDASIKMAFKLFQEKIKVREHQLELETINAQLNATNQQLEKYQQEIINRENALKESESHLSAVLDFTSDNILSIDRNYKLLTINSAGLNEFKQVLNINLEIGKNILNQIPEELRPKWKEKYDRVFLGEKVNEEVTLTIDNKTYYAELTINPIYKEGEIIGAGIFSHDVTNHKQADEVIKKQLLEKETLLREVHHRVKNNIANIEGVLFLQANSNTNQEVKLALHDAISRIQSMRILYDKLLLSKDLIEVSIKNYLEDLIHTLVQFFDPHQSSVIEKHIADFKIDSKKAFFIGIIVSELLTNVFKYAFLDLNKGKVSIFIEENQKNVKIIIQDNGIGYDESFIKNISPGFGLIIIRMLVEQLNGTYNVSNENGTNSIIQFEI